jgi:spore coat polysaccharide biosynthesis predicted glycosyltransferase SpsG
MLIVFIVDGNNELGMGHVYQVVTLVNDMLSSNYDFLEINIITKSGGPVLSFLEGAGCEVISFCNDNEIYEYLYGVKPDSVVIDNLDVSVKFSKKIKQNIGSKLLIFTNLSKANKYADVTLLADIGSDFKNLYLRDSETNRVEIFGPKYWIMRSEFFLDVNKSKCKEEVNKILLMFGGTDPSNFSMKVLDELLTMVEGFEISVVLGLGYENNDEILNLISRNKSNSSVVIFRNVSNVAKLMSMNDLVIASPGLSFFEALVVGTPVIGIHHDFIQKEAYKSLVKTVGEFELGDIPGLIRSKNFLYADSRRVLDMDIGQGKKQIIKEIVTPL